MGLTARVPLALMLAACVAPEPAPESPEAAEPAAFDDPWLAQAELPDGPARWAAIRASLAADRYGALAPRAQRDRLDVGFQAFLAAGERFDGDEMLLLAETLYARAPAVWSAFCLEGALRRGHGRYDDADAVLRERLELDGPELGRAGLVELMERRGIVAAGAGDRARERALLGAALVRGGRDARQILGLRALSRGDREEAALLFGALLAAPAGPDEARPEPQGLPAWAVRGWGLALLPPTHEALAVESPSGSADEP